MKKSVFCSLAGAFLVLSLLFSATAFAMAKPPAVHSKQWYADEARNRCQAFGDFWSPNFRYKVGPNNFKQPGNVPDYILDDNGNKIPLLTCALAPKALVYNFKTFSYQSVPAVACFDEARAEFKYDELTACQKPWLDYSNQCFTSSGAKITPCPVPDPA